MHQPRSIQKANIGSWSNNPTIVQVQYIPFKMWVKLIVRGLGHVIEQIDEYTCWIWKRDEKRFILRRGI